MNATSAQHTMVTAEVRDAFASESWSARKQATESLLRALMHELPDASTLAATIEELLDLVAAPSTASARAAAMEVLGHLGRVVTPHVLARFDVQESAARHYLDLLATIGGPGESGLMASIVQDSECDENLRTAAATALGKIGGDASRRALVGILRSASPLLALHALDALVEREWSLEVEDILPHLTDVTTRRAAVLALGISSSLEAVVHLVPLLTDTMPSVRAAACVALAGLHERLGPNTKSTVPLAVSGLGVPARKMVRELISHRDPAVWRAAIILASFAGDADALPWIMDHMEDAIAHEHGVILVQRLGPAANTVLVAASGQLKSTRREPLFRLIGALTPESVDPRLADLLSAALEEPNPSMASAAAEALKSVGGRRAMAALYRACAQEGVLGERAAEALAEVANRVGGARGDELSLLVGAIWPQHGALARNLCRIAARLGRLEHVAPLVSLLGSSDAAVRVAAATALGRIPGEHEGASALCFTLADEEPSVRAAACRSLGLLRSSMGVQPLLGASSDASPLVRAAAVAGLVAIDNPITTGRLREIILDDPSPSVVVHAIEGLGRSRQEQDLALLMSLTNAGDHEVVKAAARALSGFAAHRATAALLGMLSHARWDVRLAATEVLSARADATSLPSLRRALETESDPLVVEHLQRAVSRLDALAPEDA